MISIGGQKQNINFYVLPKSTKDKLLIDISSPIFEEFIDWVDGKISKTLHLKDVNLSFTFMDSKVVFCNFGLNRYGVESYNCVIKYDLMVYGIQQGVK